MGVTNKYRSSILLETVSPKYNRSASVWIVCNTYESFPPRIEHSTDRRTAIYCQILLDTDESPTLTLVRVLYHIPTSAELGTSIYIAGTDTGPACPKLCTVSGSYLEAVLMILLSRFNDTRTAKQH